MEQNISYLFYLYPYLCYVLDEVEAILKQLTRENEKLLEEKDSLELEEKDSLEVSLVYYLSTVVILQCSLSITYITLIMLKPSRDDICKQFGSR